MIKIKTFFKKDPNNLNNVIDEIPEYNLWVLTSSMATRKWDGTACMVKDGNLYKRYDAKNGKIAPDGAIPCCEKDEKTGHHPHWVLCRQDKPEDKLFLETFTQDYQLEDGTYELCGDFSMEIIMFSKMWISNVLFNFCIACIILLTLTVLSILLGYVIRGIVS